ncbi:MAG: glucans biosynthesis glucosyltransferase MdoH [Geminicoccaceae bacterium]
MNETDPPLRLSAPCSEVDRFSRRRAVFLALTTGTTLVAVAVMARLLGSDGMALADVALLLCFMAMLPWNVIGFWNAVIGLLLLCGSRDPVAHVLPAIRTPAMGPASARIAIVMPVHNEAPDRVLKHLEQTVASLEATGSAAAFEVFLLSDTQDTAIAAAEAALFDQWRRRSWWPSRMHYRRRPHNLDHKTGNLWEFLERDGRRFDHMLVLDADSVMSGAAIVRLVRVMEAHPEIGILQHLVVGMPNPSPFPRIFQFGMRHGMRAYTMGSAWWLGDCAPYWGHNALIRVAPFMRHCRLPVLPGRPPLGGRILSHDQVEAVLMRQAGWQVRVVPEEDGSYEENPPTLSDFVKRDLRWCQGNWQYVHLLGRSGLHAMGRVQLLLAILMYVSGPAWVLFATIGFARAMGGGDLGAAALPGAAAAWEGWALLAAMLGLVFAPKLAGVTQVLLTPALRRAYGGGFRVMLSALVELLFGFILGPIMAVAQGVFVLGLLFGRSIRWEAQLRDPRALSWREAVRGLWPQTAFGAVLGVAVWVFAPISVRWWALLFCGPLVLSVPFAVATASASLGRWLTRLGICRVPEEIDPPPILQAAGHAHGPAAAAATSPLSAVGSDAVTAPAAPSVD